MKNDMKVIELISKDRGSTHVIPFSLKPRIKIVELNVMSHWNVPTLLPLYACNSLGFVEGLKRYIHLPDLLQSCQTTLRLALYLKLSPSIEEVTSTCYVYENKHSCTLTKTLTDTILWVINFFIIS